MAVYEFNFHGDQLYGVKELGDVWIPLTPICVAIGIAFHGQIERVKRHPVLAEGIRVTRTPFTAGGPQVTFCIRLDLLNFWLATISPDRIKDPTIRERVILYQKECARALADYFLRGQATNADCSGRLLHRDLFDEPEASVEPEAPPRAEPTAELTDVVKRLEDIVARLLAYGDQVFRQWNHFRTAIVTLRQAFYGRGIRPDLVDPRKPEGGNNGR